MERTTTDLSLAVPIGWLELFLTSLKVAAVAFVVMQAKEWIDARSFDFLGVLVDALLIAGGVFVVNVILRLARSGRSSGG